MVNHRQWPRATFWRIFQDGDCFSCPVSILPIMQARFQRRILSRWETFETYVSVESELKWSEDADVFCWFCLDVLCKLCTCLDAEFVLPTCSLCEGASQTRGGWGALASGWAELSWRWVSWAGFVMSSTLSSSGRQQPRKAVVFIHI